MLSTNEVKYTLEDSNRIARIEERTNTILQRFDKLETSLGREIKSIYDTRDPVWEKFSRHIEVLEKDKLDASVWPTFETRITNLEKWKAGIIGGFGLVTVVVGLVVYIYLAEHAQIQKDLDQHEIQSQKQFEQIISKLK